LRYFDPHDLVEGIAVRAIEANWFGHERTLAGIAHQGKKLSSGYTNATHVVTAKRSIARASECRLAFGSGSQSPAGWAPLVRRLEIPGLDLSPGHYGAEADKDRTNSQDDDLIRKRHGKLPFSDSMPASPKSTLT
jgi:hypothetical protein